MTYYYAKKVENGKTVAVYKLSSYADFTPDLIIINEEEYLAFID
ncbi:MAG: hypothetical protein UR78_C0028G0012 [Candidatus Moranbacteria bacterium GW2011_GWF2_35_39]|nr:MAG: hypothetical protein UR78_C0028G0012 [Candidatus Moranbacteria bacterium GW2011_GWF2_35_39]